jgi:hypothetical protein
MIRELKTSDGLLVTFGQKTTMMMGTDLRNGKIAVDLYSIRELMDGIPDSSDIIGFSPKVRMTFTSAQSVEALIQTLLSVQDEFRTRAGDSLAHNIERGK